MTGQPRHVDPTKIHPLPDVYNGAYAHAFRIDFKALEKERSGQPHATLDAWWVEAIPADRFHPIIDTWGVWVIHLRDLVSPAGIVLPAHRAYPTAQYEFVIGARHDVANHDGHRRTHVTPQTSMSHILRPLNVVKQFDFGSIGDTDKRDTWARMVCEAAIYAIVRVGMSPEADMSYLIPPFVLANAPRGMLPNIENGAIRDWWDRSIDGTVEHMLTGGHATTAH